MNSKKAKSLRRQVYGDKSQRASARVYGNKNNSGRRFVSGTIFNQPNTPRAIYQQMKRTA